MEEIAKQITIQISHAVEILAAAIVGIAVMKVAILYGISAVMHNTSKNPSIRNISWKRPEEIRVSFGSAVALSLELLLGADVLATAVAPSWDDIGKLAAIALLRTLLNYFLERELKHIAVNHSSVTISQKS